MPLRFVLYSTVNLMNWSQLVDCQFRNVASERNSIDAEETESRSVLVWVRSSDKFMAVRG